MLLKSSSTPLLGSLLPSFSDSPSNHAPTHIHGMIPCANQSFRKPMFHSPSPAEAKPSTGFRRVQSEGNLEGLGDGIDELSLPKKPARRTSCCTLEAIPSFSLRRPEDVDSDDDEEDTVWNRVRVENLVSERVGETGARDCRGLKFEDEGKMYLASGFGVSGISYGGDGGGGGGSYRPVAFDRDGGGDIGMEEYYKRMLEENPGDALFLRNYARFLYEKKKDLDRAEEYYSRAILSDPTDGEILSQYAKLIWELHHDKERATNYFKRAVQVSSEDSHVHAAYASFLWETEADNDDDNNEENASEKITVGQELFRHGLMASATA